MVARSVLVLAVFTLAACGVNGESGASGAEAALDACDLIGPGDVSTVARLEGTEFRPGERYPRTGACVWWSETLPLHSASVALNADATEIAPCGSSGRAAAGSGDVVVSVCRHEERAQAVRLATESGRLRDFVVAVSPGHT